MIECMLILLLFINSAQHPYVELPSESSSYTEYCQLVGCAPNGTDVVGALGDVLPSSMPSSNVSTLNASLRVAYGRGNLRGCI